MDSLSTATFAQIDWTDPANPASRQFNDIYFSTAGGEEETIHTFIAGNQIMQRLSALAKGSTFTIGETGFGTGSNLLVLLNQCSEIIKDRQIRLEYFSVEKYPLEVADMQFSHKHFANFPDITDAFLATYQKLNFQETVVSFTLLNNQVKVLLYLTDINQALTKWRQNYKGRVNAWFLDGYAPSKNPDMWSQELFDTMFLCAERDCTLATYTVAARVRQGLSGAGFHIAKAQGFGRKKEMLLGSYPKSTVNFNF